MSNSFIPDIGAALQQSIFGAGDGISANPIRVPMSFTSTRRLRLLNPDFAGTSEAFKSVPTQYETEIRNQTLGISRGRFLNDMPVIIMKVNPNSITWRQPKRIVKRDTRNGSVFFHFSDDKGQNNDILVLEFRGNTGNIDLRGDVTVNNGVFNTQETSIGVGARQKQLIWHNLWNLTREQMLLDDNSINTFQIIYSSPIIPIQISLLGFFSSVLEWTDSAEKPFSRDYSFSFTVQKTIPDLNALVSSIQTTIFDPAYFTKTT